MLPSASELLELETPELLELDVTVTELLELETPELLELDVTVPELLELDVTVPELLELDVFCDPQGPKLEVRILFRKVNFSAVFPAPFSCRLDNEKPLKPPRLPFSYLPMFILDAVPVVSLIVKLNLPVAEFTVVMVNIGSCSVSAWL